MSPLQTAALSAAKRIAGLLKFFPSSLESIVEVALVLDEICRSPEHCEWLAEQMVTRFDEWTGPKTLRTVAREWDGTPASPVFQAQIARHKRILAELEQAALKDFETKEHVMTEAAKQKGAKLLSALATADARKKAPAYGEAMRRLAHIDSGYGNATD